MEALNQDLVERQNIRLCTPLMDTRKYYKRKNAQPELVGNLGFVKVAETSEVPAGKMKMVKLEEKEILMANVNGNYYAIANRCTHAGGDLSKGSLEGNIVSCPKHGAKFDVTTGKVVSGPKILFLRSKIKDERSYEVKVEGKEVLLKIE